jgi:hypothetical protein
MKSNPAKHPSYSDILVQFISPLIDGSEDEESMMELASAGMLAWNYTFLDKMPPLLRSHYLNIIEEAKRTRPQGQWVFDLLCARKKELFADHQQYIVEVTKRKEGKVEDGRVNLVLRVESAPIDKIFGRN